MQTDAITPLIQQYTVDFASNNNFLYVKGIQGDGYGTRYVDISLTNNGQPYMINNNAVTAVIRGTKPDNHAIFNKCEILDNNTIRVEITQQMSAIAGKSNYEISILSNSENRTLTSFPFFILISKSSFDIGYVVSSDEFGLLIEKINQVHLIQTDLSDLKSDMQNSKKNCDDATKNCMDTTSQANKAISDMNTLHTQVSAAEARRVSDENDRIYAETQRNGSEQLRTANENTRIAAESARTAAENDRENAETARITAETQRAGAEQLRTANENARIAAESARTNAESDRENAEAARDSAESQRIAAESDREIAEHARIGNEAVRESNESARQTTAAAAIVRANNAADRADNAAQACEAIISGVIRAEIVSPVEPAGQITGDFWLQPMSEEE